MYARPYFFIHRCVCVLSSSMTFGFFSLSYFAATVSQSCGDQHLLSQSERKRFLLAGSLERRNLWPSSRRSFFASFSPSLISSLVNQCDLQSPFSTRAVSKRVSTDRARQSLCIRFQTGVGHFRLIFGIEYLVTGW